MIEKILLIEDDKFFAVLTAKMLAPAAVRIAYNGAEGLEYLKSERFDLIVTDIVMPEKDGIATIMDIRKGDPATPILAMSGGGNIGSQGDLLLMAKQLGATATLVKPFDRAALLAKVQECFPDRKISAP
jgi:CheY-like chemotaxis protein